MTKHLRDCTLEELESITCCMCSNSMAEYACQNSMQDNEAYCVDCCEFPCCYEDEEEGI